MSEPLIEIQNLSKMYRLFRHPRYRILNLLGFPVPQRTYNEFWALRDINLTINQGERLGIIGRNGAGKSTLLKIIAGLLQPTGGVVKVRGKVQALMELGTGFHHEFTGRENVFAALSYQGITGKEAQRRFEEIVEFSELEEFIDNPFKTYSAGMQARLTFSVATAVEPEILIIDEVLGAGDAYFASKCMERMKVLTNDRGATVLFVSHDMNAVQAMCENVIWLKRGRVIQEGDALAVTKSYYKEVREEEYLRSLANLQGLARKNAVISGRNTLNKPLLFHFITAKGHSPRGKHKIYQLRLCSGDKVLGKIAVGDSMDNSSDESAHLLCHAGYTDWSQPQRDQEKLYRFFIDCRGRYKHAPFQFDISLKLLEDATNEENLYLEVLGDFDPIDQICVEIYEDQGYRRLGIVTSEREWQRFDLHLTDKLTQTISLDSRQVEENLKSYRFFFQISNGALSESILVSSISLGNREDQEVRADLIGLDEKISNDKIKYLGGQNGWHNPKMMDNKLARIITHNNNGNSPGFEVNLSINRERFLRQYVLSLYALPNRFNSCQILFEDEGKLVQVGEILPEEDPDWKYYVFDLDIITNLDTNFKIPIEKRPDKSLVTWQIPDPRIEKVRFLDIKSQPVTGIEEGDDLTIEINYHSSSLITEAIFTISIFLVDGTVLFRTTATLVDLGVKSIYGRGKVQFNFNPFYGGPAEYIVSAGIYKFLDLTKYVQSIPYDQHDRAYRFRVWKKLGIVADMGLMNIPFTLKHILSD